MDLKSRKILVTGSEGFIGSHLTEHLVRCGCSVRAFVLYNSLNSRGWLESCPQDIQDNVEIFFGDVRDLHGVTTAMRGCDVVFHLAALISIPYSYHAPASYVETNVGGTLNVVQAAQDLGIERIVHTSTSEVYGSARFVPITEEHPLQGQSPYSASKIGADHIALSFHSAFNTPVAVIRPFNTYGPRQSARAVIPTIITQIAAGNHVLKLGALHPTRDFNYVRDTVSAFLAVAESDATVGNVVNVGSNYEISIGEVAELIARLMGTEMDIATDLRRFRPPASEVERLWADNTKASTLMGWQPQYGGREGLCRGLAETIAWFLEPENLRSYRDDGYQI